jgi:uncharacterized membrane protein
MDPALLVALLWLLFAGTHIGLASRPIRSRLVARLGELGFGVAFSLVAAVLYTLLVTTYAAHRWEGAPGLALGGHPWLRPLLIGLVVGGAVLIAAALGSYGRSPYALFSTVVRTPRGVERITRHPFFAGVVLFAVAHMLLATRLVGAVFAAGFGMLAALGAWHQDAKLLRLRGRPYADYVGATSAVPFAAILAGRQRLVWSELPLGAAAVGVGLAVVLRTVHDQIFAHGGAWFIGTVVGGAALLALQAIRRQRRARPLGAPFPAGHTP